MDTKSDGTSIVTLYLGGVEKLIHKDSGGNITKTEIKRYLGPAIITDNYNSSGAYQDTDTHYAYKDHLGSLNVIANENGQIEQNLSFDAWGQRRDVINWSDFANLAALLPMQSTGLTPGSGAEVNDITTRGFTGHEMADEVGIVHMNGRIYDARLGRFLQADPFVQSPSDTQMLNRYSYVRNNPLNATDPSGHFIFTLIAVALAAADVVTGIYIAVAFGIAAFTDALIAGASLRDAFLSGVIGAFTAYAGGQISGSGGGLFGNFFGSELIGEAVSMGLVGGIGAVLQGGKFGHGFVGAGVGAAIGGSSWFKGLKHVGSRIFTKAIIGGTISEVTGGKFANGAATATMFAVAAETGNTYKGNNEIGFRREIFAAREALKVADPLTEKSGHEYAGRIYQKEENDRYFYSPAITEGKVDTANPYLSKAPEGSKTTAFYHTHPEVKGGHYDSENFSNYHGKDFSPNITFEGHEVIKSSIVSEVVDGDIPFARTHHINAYLSTPSDRLKFYSYELDNEFDLGGLYDE